ncbi:MAG: YicC family protein [Clostridia bacterium]|nr:YicC family protein [Clostridia bacterium]
MIKSMTGFGRAEYENCGREYVVEIKTINHRYSDVSVRIPRQYSYLEELVRRFMTKAISRGKVEVNIQINCFADDKKQILFDENLMKKYLEEANRLEKTLGVKNDLSFCRLLSLPEIVNVSSETTDDEYAEELKCALEQAIEKLNTMRTKEGETLRKDILLKLQEIEEEFKEICKKADDVVPEYRNRLIERLKELEADQLVDETRLAGEVAIFADRSAIDEEIVRFRSHIKQFSDNLELNEPVGKKLDFIVQEMNREINTIGSKANCLEITNSVITIKNEIEKVREQIQNIE